MGKLGHKRGRIVRGRGNNTKFRALRVLDVVYNASNNELVRTKTLVKNAIIQVDALPLKQWYSTHYGVELGKKKGEKAAEAVKKSGHVKAKLAHRLAGQKLDSAIEDQFNSGRLLACISSRPGQTGRCDGYILEGEELAFYKKKLEKKKKQ